MYDIILSFITAFVLTFFAVPSIVHIAKVKRLMDEPGDRHAHTVSTPSLGGIGIFAGALFSIILWTPFDAFGELQYILCGFIVIFLVGAKDDILPMSPGKKMLGQVFAAFLIVIKSNVKLTSLYGIFGIYALPEWASIFLSIFTIIAIINAFNLIDGINGLSGSISTLICIIFGVWFFLTENYALSIVAAATAGATLAFLNYNITPAKIFMGDTGSLLLGLICSILAIKFIETNNAIISNPVAYGKLVNYTFSSVPAVTMGILILPIFDTMRVFTTRILKGKSPFRPDRTHIHHILLDLGLSHMQATAALFITNVLFILFVFSFHYLDALVLIVLIYSMAGLLTLALQLYGQHRARQLNNLKS